MGNCRARFSVPKPVAGLQFQRRPRRKIFSLRAPACDVRLYPALLEAMFAGMMVIEHAWLAAGAAPPFGNPGFAVGLKPARK